MKFILLVQFDDPLFDGALFKTVAPKVHPRTGHESPVGSKGIALLFL